MPLKNDDCLLKNGRLLCNSRYFADTERGYLSRGHCLLELATSRLPRIDMFGKWYIPGSEKTGQWGSVVVLDLDTKESQRLENGPGKVERR